MIKSKTAADFILKHNLQNICDLDIAEKLNSFYSTSVFTRTDVSNARRKIQEGYLTKESKDFVGVSRRKNTLHHGDYLDFAVYIAKTGDRFSSDDKRKVISLLSDKWAV